MYTRLEHVCLVVISRRLWELAVQTRARPSARLTTKSGARMPNQTPECSSQANYIYLEKGGGEKGVLPHQRADGNLPLDVI